MAQIQTQSVLITTRCGIMQYCEFSNFQQRVKSTTNQSKVSCSTLRTIPPRNSKYNRWPSNPQSLMTPLLKLLAVHQARFDLTTSALLVQPKQPGRNEIRKYLANDYHHQHQQSQLVSPPLPKKEVTHAHSFTHNDVCVRDK